jgi:predicted ATP-grasp superfamily ATP-dependent carboligase
LRNLFSKNEVMHLVAEAGVAIPRTVIPRDEAHVTGLVREFDMPIVVKGEKGAAAQLVRIVRRRDDVVERYREIVHLERGYAGRPTLQEFIPGDMFLVGAIVEDGEVVRISSHRKDVMFPARGGATVRGTTTWHPELIASALAVFRALRYTGIGSLDFIRDPRDGRFKFLEINPRVWGSFGLSQRSVDMIGAYAAIAQGLPVTRDLEYRQGVRYHRITGELRLLGQRPWRLFGFLKDSLDPRVTSDLEWRDPRPYLPSFTRGKRRVTQPPADGSRRDDADVTTRRSAAGGG